jgi:hypothetical protein
MPVRSAPARSTHGRVAGPVAGSRSANAGDPPAVDGQRAVALPTLRGVAPIDAVVLEEVGQILDVRNVGDRDEAESIASSKIINATPGRCG